MPLRNKVLVLVFIVSCALVGMATAQTSSPTQPPQNSSAQAGTQTPAGSEMDEPLKPEDLVVPSNAALANTAPALATAENSNPATAPANTAAVNPANTAPVNNVPAGNVPATPAAANIPNQPGSTVQIPPGRGVQKQGKGFVLRTEVDEVVLHATVVDAHQHLVTNLDRNAFSVFENGQPQPITSFRHEDVPVAVGILVDNSGSMRDKRAAVTQAALNFVRSSNPEDRAFVVNFDTDPYIDQDFTASIPKLKEAMDRIDSRGGTALYDAVSASADHLMKEPGIDKKLERKVLLIVTDGWDNASVLSLEQAIRRVQVENGPTIYTIGILDEDAKKKGKRALRELAEATGGVAYFPKDLAEVDSITQQVAHDIRNQYTIGFKRNPEEGPGYRTIKVEARANGYKNLQVRTRSGYFQSEEKTAKK